MDTVLSSRAHSNPVYGSYFADPFAWFHNGTYYAIGTGAQEAEGRTLGKVFPLLQSQDFFEWHFASNALIRPDPKLGNTFWAPAVAYADGRFYLYYSVGHEDKDHQLRVAVSDSPQGPYEDTGRPLTELTRTPFAIDPHPFQDNDGTWYLFYARDFLDSEGGARPGTALAAAKLDNMVQLGPGETTILRARYDWQRFAAPRQMYGRTWDWHTLEGPCVVQHDGKYFCLYSGGRWETESYGVDFAVADHILGPYNVPAELSAPRLLKTLPGKVIGPGHNSVIKGPDQSDYIIYHAWDPSQKGRYLFIDRLIWTEQGPCCLGPTWSPAFETGLTQPAPAS